jgi:TRAP-type C4-dicarboxylate transport system permease small subunit
MSTLIDIIVFVIVIALVAITASYAAASAKAITDISNWANDPKLAAAHKYLSWAASIGWIYIVILIVIIVLLIIFIEVAYSLVSTIVAFANVATVLVLLAIGILAAIGTTYIRQSSASGTDVAKNKALVASIVSLGSLALLIVYYIISYSVKYYNHQKDIREQAEALIELGEI